MTDRELVSTPMDKRRVGTCIPRHASSRENDKPARQGRLWHAVESQRVDGTWGVFPVGLMEFCLKAMGHPPPCQVLHVCSGGLPAGHGVRVDLRASMKPDVVADGRALPFRDESFPAVLLDPPYSVEYAESLYGTEYPRPSHLLAEASRVTKPGGRIAILHYLVPMLPPACKLINVYGVTQGLNYRIRALTVYEKTREMEWPA